MNKTSDANALCELFLKPRLASFNAYGVALCRNTLLYRILFDPNETAFKMKNLDTVFDQPLDMEGFYTRVWETLFQERLPTNLRQDDFYIDEIGVHDLQRLVFDKT